MHPTQPQGSQGCVHFERLDNMSGSNLAYCSSCSRMNERGIKKTTRFTYLANQHEPVLNSLSTLQQYLRSHHSQFDCLHQQTQSFKVSTCIKHEKQFNHNSPVKTSLVNVVFTFNISAKCFTPALPIALSGWTAKGAKCITKRRPTWRFTYMRGRAQSMSCSLSTPWLYAYRLLLQCG